MTTSSTTSTTSSTTSSTTTGGGGGDGACASDLLIPGEQLDESALPEGVFRCGESTGISDIEVTQINGVPLVNDQTYVVAVAAYDQSRNIGKLSELACETPRPVDDFYELYRRAGGQAGGGYCSVSGVLGRPDAAAILAALLGCSAGALALRRKARRARRGRTTTPQEKE